MKNKKQEDMENTNKLSQEEVDDLRKSLMALDMEESEIEDFIEKAIKDKEEENETPAEQDKEGVEGEKKEEESNGTEETMAEKAKGGKKENEAEEGITKSTDEEDLEKCYAKKSEIEKSISDLEEKMGKKKVEKSVDDDIHTAESFDIEKAFGERFVDIEKSLTAKFEGEFSEMNDLIKGLTDDLSAAKEEIKKIGDMPMGTKSIMTKANFFEKSLTNDNDELPEKSLSIMNDREDIIKGMTDMMDKEQDADIKQMLANGISDLTVNKKPTNHGISALAHMSRKQNITLEQ